MDVIDAALVEPLEECHLPHALDKLPCEGLPVLPEVSESRVRAMLSKLNPPNARDADEIPNWQYSDLLAFPVSKIYIYINTSLNEQCLHVDFTPLPKKKQVEDLKKDLRQISLTVCLSKVARDCVV